ncbi:MAG: hypothetical protein LKG26_05760 [Saccharofermentans sp.]|jgi:CHASE3 domain sensor protein|nr:hypothetical protein [Mageeibacillus sp.]MCI1263932.1 hypothetical protein [Saccharofermentans sp.]MCI1275573.1 hypothetical protein [Saccharofermentans sp.]MCI1768873.1 hypothetical protein [Mageeibacillus sp.]MCI2044630.1 hypothetical protein [Mageeibacillus sp.]
MNKAQEQAGRKQQRFIKTMAWILIAAMLITFVFAIVVVLVQQARYGA